jgi:hypothetical protein
VAAVAAETSSIMMAQDAWQQCGLALRLALLAAAAGAVDEELAEDGQA